MVTFWRKRRGVRTVREAGHIAWMYHTYPWSRAYAIHRVGRMLYAIHRESGEGAVSARDLTRLEPLILADVQARPVATLRGGSR